jgi:ferric-dicitrate binding protein FerR (iron transport regulator)
VSKRENGKLEYSEVNSSRANGSSGQASAIDHSPSYNTLSTPKGGQYFLELPDGSKVWLNAASSIRYPTAFDGSERLVELTGEAYFEIKKNHDKPFRVNFTSTSGAGEDREGTVEVLGTHFNVNAYNDESEIKTTLLEGAVKVMSRQSSVDKSAYVTALADKSANNMVVLKPGEQVSISHASQLSHPIPVQTEEAVAWKNGLFYFDNANIQAIMRQLARWYNVDVVYKGKIPARRFAGQVSRNSKLSQVLRILELSKVHFTIEGNVVTVLP